MQVMLEVNKPYRWADPTEVLFDAVRVVKRAAL
jgi:hypothetical protein